MKRWLIPLLVLVAAPPAVATGGQDGAGPARVAKGLSYYFEQKAEVYIACDLVEDAGGRHPTYFVGRWFDHADQSHTGGGWLIGHAGRDPAVRASALGTDARLEPDVGPTVVSGPLGFVRGPIKAGTTLRMTWLSWHVTLGCIVTVDGEPVEPFELEPHRYGQIRAADVESGVALDVGSAGATVAGRAPFGEPGFLLALGTPKDGEDLWAADGSGDRAPNDPLLGMYFHQPTTTRWTLQADRVARASGMPLLIWASLPLSPLGAN